MSRNEINKKKLLHKVTINVHHDRARLIELWSSMSLLHRFYYAFHKQEFFKLVSSRRVILVENSGLDKEILKL